MIVAAGACDVNDDDDDGGGGSDGLEINFDFARWYCLRIKLDIRERFLFVKDLSQVELFVTEIVFFCECDVDEDEDDFSRLADRIS